jgi:hypothetical protein
MQARDLGRHIRDLGNLGVQEHKHNKMQEGTNRTRTVRIPQPMLNCNCLAHHAHTCTAQDAHTHKDGGEEQVRTT